MVSEFGFLPWSLSLVAAVAIAAAFGLGAFRAFARAGSMPAPARIVRSHTELREGRAVVEGTLSGEERPLASLEIGLEEADGAYVERSRTVRLAPMELRLRDGSRLTIAAEKATLRTPRLTARGDRREATVASGDVAIVHGRLVPPPESDGSPYRASSKASWTVTGDPSLVLDTTRSTWLGATHRRWGRFAVVALVAVQAFFFGDLWALTLFGEACEGTVVLATTSLSSEPGGHMRVQSGRYSTRDVAFHGSVEHSSSVLVDYALGDGTRGRVTLGVSEATFAQLSHGARVPLVVADVLGVARLGTEPGAQPAVVIAAAVLTALFLLLMRGARRAAPTPWYARAPYTEPLPERAPTE